MRSFTRLAARRSVPHIFLHDQIFFAFLPLMAPVLNHLTVFSTLNFNLALLCVFHIHPACLVLFISEPLNALKFSSPDISFFPLRGRLYCPMWLNHLPLFSIFVLLSPCNPSYESCQVRTSQEAILEDPSYSLNQERPQPFLAFSQGS